MLREWNMVRFEGGYGQEGGDSLSFNRVMRKRVDGGTLEIGFGYC